jgi:tetraacyldisaccharide 4'-kinase
MIEHLITRQWYGQPTWVKLFLPLTYLYRFGMMFRRFLYRTGHFKTHKLNVPVWVVGNITTGGNGKTPFVIALAELLSHHGYKPGVISKGYKGTKVTHEPQLVLPQSNPVEVGDEPVVIARNCACPVAVCTNRVIAATYLIQQHGCTILLTDDGYQDYSLERDVSIILVDEQKRFGNGYQLPSGPLRESITTLNIANLIVYKANDSSEHPHDHTFHLEIEGIYSCQRPDIRINPALLKQKRVVAVAGIANPNSFFSALEKIGLAFTPLTFPNHMSFDQDDVYQPDNAIVIMTEKDAVKCRNFSDNNLYFAKTKLISNLRLDNQIQKLIENIK